MQQDIYNKQKETLKWILSDSDSLKNEKAYHQMYSCLIFHIFSILPPLKFAICLNSTMLSNFPSYIHAEGGQKTLA